MTNNPDFTNHDAVEFDFDGGAGWAFDHRENVPSDVLITTFNADGAVSLVRTKKGAIARYTGSNKVSPGNLDLEQSDCFESIFDGYEDSESILRHKKAVKVAGDVVRDALISLNIVASDHGISASMMSHAAGSMLDVIKKNGNNGS